MSSIVADMIVYLKTKSAITAVIGSGTSARIYEEAAPQNTATPYVELLTFGGESNQYLGGITGLAQNRIQIYVTADTESAAHSLGELIRLAPLQGYRGTMNGRYVNTVNALSGYYTFTDRPIRGSDVRRYVLTRDYSVHYQEPTS